MHSMFPINWDLFCQSLIPDWIDLLSKKLHPGEFKKKYIPLSYDDLKWPSMEPIDYCFHSFELLWDEIPIENMESEKKKWKETFKFEANYLRSTKYYNGLLKHHYRFIDFATLVLNVAIRQSAYFDITETANWERWHEAYSDDILKMKIIGAYKRFNLLEYFFDFSQEPSTYEINYRDKPSIDRDFLKIISDLFLSERGIIGTILCSSGHRWPTSSCLAEIQGYLSPSEVRELSLHIKSEKISSIINEADDSGLFLFKDRICASALSGAGLITLL